MRPSSVPVIKVLHHETSTTPDTQWISHHTTWDPVFQPYCTVRHSVLQSWTLRLELLAATWWCSSYSLRDPAVLVYTSSMRPCSNPASMMHTLWGSAVVIQPSYYTMRPSNPDTTPWAESVRRVRPSILGSRDQESLGSGGPTSTSSG